MWHNSSYCSIEVVTKTGFTAVITITVGGCRGRDRLVVGFTTTYGITWVRIPLRRGVLDTTLCDKVCQWPPAGQWFSPGTTVSSTNRTDPHDITEILLKVALNNINQTNYHKWALAHSSSYFKLNIHWIHFIN